MRSVLGVAVGLSLKLDQVRLGVWVHSGVLLPDVVVVLVVLVGVGLLQFGLFLPPLQRGEVQQGRLAFLEQLVVVAVVGGWVNAAAGVRRVVLHLVEVDALADRPLHVGERLQHVDLAPVPALPHRLLPPSHARHVHHALAALRAHQRSRLSRAQQIAGLAAHQGFQLVFSWRCLRG
jgi:hypothetical protein